MKQKVLVSPIHITMELREISKQQRKCHGVVRTAICRGVAVLTYRCYCLPDGIKNYEIR